MLPKWMRLQSSPRAKTIPQHSVVIVSDDVASLDALEAALKENNYFVYSMRTVPEALLLLGTIPLPDAIICDFAKPKDAGKDFLDRARIRYGKRVLPPILFLMDEPEDEEAARLFGANDLLAKPFTNEALLNSINGMIANRAKPIAS
ncbi:MAG: response regulator [bacterium]|nr:response regulator [bacterium]